MTTTTRTVTHRQILDAAEAIKTLDALDDKSKPLFTFEPKARLAFVKRLRRLSDMAKDVNDVRTQMIAAAGLVGDDKLDAPVARQKFGADWNAFLNSNADTFEMAAIQWEWLNTDKNPISIQALAAMAWLIDGMPEE